MELRLALRNVLRRPALSASIVVAIALAVAVTSALFSVLDGLLFRPLPFHEPDSLITMDYRWVGGEPPLDLLYGPKSAERREILRARVEASPLVAAASQAGFAGFFATGDARDLGLEVPGIDSRFFRLLGLPRVLGVDFSLEDERSASTLSQASDAPLPIIIGHVLWTRLYGADSAVLGVKELAGRRVRIVGVMGPGVKFPGETNVWAPVPVTRDRPPT